MANIDENTIAEVRSLYYNSTELIKRIKSNPTLSDPIIKLVVEILQYDCLLGTTKENAQAKQILTKAKASRYIPEITRVKRPSDKMMKYFQLDYNVLFLLVELYGEVIRETLRESHYKLHNKEELVTHTFRSVFHDDPPKNVLDHTGTMTDIALSFISYRFNISTNILIPFFHNRRNLKTTQLGGQLIQ